MSISFAVGICGPIAKCFSDVPVQSRRAFVLFQYSVDTPRKRRAIVRDRIVLPVDAIRFGWWLSWRLRGRTGWRLSRRAGRWLSRRASRRSGWWLSWRWRWPPSLSWLGSCTSRRRWCRQSRRFCRDWIVNYHTLVIKHIKQEFVNL